MYPNIKPDYIVYHSNCHDGFGGAWCFHELFGSSDITYFPGVHNPDDVPDFTGKRVFMVDFCYEKKVMDVIVTQAVYVTVFDHHITSQKTCEDLKNEFPVKFAYVHDLSKSGCQIAWDSCFPDKPRPDFIDYIGDRDLWKFELPHSRVINIGIFQYETTFESFNRLRDTSISDVYDEGYYINKYIENQVVPLFVKNSSVHKMKVGDTEYTVAAVECPYIWRSDVGEALYKNESVDFVLLWSYYLKKNSYSISLRSRKNSTDVSKIAEHFGGGGHTGASGFKHNNIRSLFKTTTDIV